MDRFGPVWPHLTLIGSDSPWLAPIGPNWPGFAPIGTNCQISTLYLIVPNWPQMHGHVLIFVVLYHLYGNRILSCMNKYGVKWSIVILCGFIIVFFGLFEFVKPKQLCTICACFCSKNFRPEFFLRTKHFFTKHYF